MFHTERARLRGQRMVYLRWRFTVLSNHSFDSDTVRVFSAGITPASIRQGVLQVTHLPLRKYGCKAEPADAIRLIRRNLASLGEKGQIEGRRVPLFMCTRPKEVS